MEAQQNKFMFTTGIENSYPTIALPDGTIKRVDEMGKQGTTNIGKPILTS